MTGMPLLTDRAEAHRVSRAEFETIRAWPPFDTDRYELLDGEVLVTPSPRPTHQEVVSALVGLLRPAVPADQAVLPAPLQRYWVVAPARRSATIYRLADGGYVEEQHAEGRTATVTAPVEVTFSPAGLLGGASD